MKTHALVLHAPHDLRFEPFELPELLPTEVSIRVHACGVCGTDLHMFHGDAGAFDNAFPLIMGHEFAGVVEAVGEHVTHLQAGDHVAVDPNVYCGACPACLRGDVHFCEHMVGVGTTRHGGFAEICNVPGRAAYKLPAGLPLEAGAMMEPLSCCLHGTDRAGITPGSTVCIIGFGSIGQMIFQLAHVAGAAKIVVIEPIESKRARALEMGATLALSPQAVDTAAGLLSHGVAHVHSVIECVGRKETMELAVSLASNRGTVMLFGLTAPGTKLEILAFEAIFKKEISITGSFINPLVADRVLALLDAQRVDMSQIITDRIPLSEGAKVFTDDRYRSHGKILLGNF